jgi:hypothetical protein
MERIIMLVLGIFVLCSFFTFSAISFRKHRLPKKLREYKRLRRALGPAISREGENQLVDEIVQNDYRGWDYALPVFFVTLFCALGFWVLFASEPPLILVGVSHGGESIDPGQLSYTRLSLVAIGMAILGSYIWSIQYIVRRLINLDLVPGAYYSIGTRIIFACFLSVIMHHYIQSLDAGLKKELIDLLPVIAFFIGIFPQRALQYLQEKMFFLSKSEKQAHKLPLDMIEGVTLFSRVRLSEVGIDNAQNLAEANFLELILRTPFNPLLMLDWISQAKLYLVVKDGMEGLRKACIRNSFDLLAAQENDCLDKVAELSGIEAGQLSIICKILSEDPKTESLKTMRKQLSEDQFYLDLMRDSEGPDNESGDVSSEAGIH